MTVTDGQYDNMTMHVTRSVQVSHGMQRDPGVFSSPNAEIPVHPLVGRHIEQIQCIRCGDMLLVKMP